LQRRPPISRRRSAGPTCAPNWLTPAPEPAHNLWFLRDQRLIAQAKNWGAVAPFYVDLESPQPAGGVPAPGPLMVSLPYDYLQYAITWFGLAAAVTIAFGLWLRGRLADALNPSAAVQRLITMMGITHRSD
jgi:cytochrome oxidase assembly protein ShyY1